MSWRQPQYVVDEETQYYDGFDDRATFEYMWCIWPRRCYLTKSWIFADIAVRGRAVWSGPGEDAIEDRWYLADEYVLKVLKGK